MGVSCLAGCGGKGCWRCAGAAQVRYGTALLAVRDAFAGNLRLLPI